MILLIGSSALHVTRYTSHATSDTLGIRNVQRQTCSVKRRVGFTLLELLLVIVIIAILLGLSIPRINKTIKNTFFRSFVNKTYLFLDYAATQSTLKSVVLEVKFDLGEGRIFLSNGKAGNTLSQIEIPRGIDIATDNEIIMFYPDGTSEAFKVVVSDEEDRKAGISSAGFDGKIKTDE